MNGFNILLVASKEWYCQEAREFFARYNYRLTIAENYQIALNGIAQAHFDAVICSLDALGSGCELLQQFQKLQHIKIPLIFLGDRYNNKQHRQAMEMGADDILFLPYSLGDIKAALAVRLQKKQALLQESYQELQQLRHNITTYLPHEMRTALTGIIAASELLLRQDIEPLIIKEMLRCINTSGKKLSHLIHNFLLYSELQAIAKDNHKVDLLQKQQTSNVVKAIAKVIGKYSQRYSRQADFILELENAAVKISSSCLNKLIAELIDNACKFSRSGTPIKITSTIADNQYLIAIANYGRGMTAEQIARIGLGNQFDRIIYEQQGFGLGLTIARNIVQLHGGMFVIESTVDSQTNVKVTLPLAKIGIGDRKKHEQFL